MAMAGLTLINTACATGSDAPRLRPSPVTLRPYAVGHIIDTKTGEPVSFPDWMVSASIQDVIYLGEEHRNAAHIQAAVRVLEGLLNRDRQPVLALEMFGWDGQVGLSRYLSQEDTPREQFLKDAHWNDNWGGDFSDYEPLIAFARSHTLGVAALNPPLALVRQVATQGLSQALHIPEMGRWGMWNQSYVDDPAYRAVIVHQVRQCHGGLSDDAYQRMYEASMFRDEGMAKTITDTLRLISGQQNSGPPNRRAGPVVSYTGGGHIQYQLPIPKRVMRRQQGMGRQMTVYLISYDPDRPGEVSELINEGIADYVWLTPVGPQGLPRRCR